MWDHVPYILAPCLVGSVLCCEAELCFILLLVRDCLMGSSSYLCRWQVERKVILSVMWLLELNLLIPKQTFTFPLFPSLPSCSPACSLPPTVSRTPPSLSASWPSTPVTMASSWSSTPQTLQLQQSRYSVCSSLTPPLHFSCSGLTQLFLSTL